MAQKCVVISINYFTGTINYRKLNRPAKANAAPNHASLLAAQGLLTDVSFNT